jgi:tRNA 2-thiouridine synthesizing protein A
MGQASTRTLDARGRACPMPIVELMRVVSKMAAGEAVEITADDRAFPADVAAWCKKTGNTLVSLSENHSVHVAVVRKAG